MKHEIIVEKLSEYRDGALGASESAAISRHLSDCADCATTLTDWERLAKAFLRRSPAPTSFQTEAFTARVMGRLPAAAAQPLSWLTGRWLMPALGLSFVFLALSFRPYGAEVVDPTATFLMGADRATPSLRAEPPAADVLGLDSDDR